MLTSLPEHWGESNAGGLPVESFPRLILPLLHLHQDTRRQMGKLRPRLPHYANSDVSFVFWALGMKPMKMWKEGLGRQKGAGFFCVALATLKLTL